MMDSFKMGEIITDMFKDKETCQHYGIVLEKAEYDEFDGSVGVVVRDKGKLKRFVIEVKEV
jgi:hypothetical protein